MHTYTHTYIRTYRKTKRRTCGGVFLIPDLQSYPRLKRSAADLEPPARAAHVASLSKGRMLASPLWSVGCRIRGQGVGVLAGGRWLVRSLGFWGFPPALNTTLFKAFWLLVAGSVQLG